MYTLIRKVEFYSLILTHCRLTKKSNDDRGSQRIEEIAIQRQSQYVRRVYSPRAYAISGFRQGIFPLWRFSRNATGADRTIKFLQLVTPIVHSSIVA